MSNREKIGRKLMVWVAGLEHNDFYDAMGQTPDQAWKNMPLWERDDFKRAGDKMQAHTIKRVLEILGEHPSCDYAREVIKEEFEIDKD